MHSFLIHHVRCGCCCCCCFIIILRHVWQGLKGLVTRVPHKPTSLRMTNECPFLASVDICRKCVSSSLILITSFIFHALRYVIRFSCVGTMRHSCDRAFRKIRQKPPNYVAETHIHLVKLRSQTEAGRLSLICRKDYNRIFLYVEEETLRPAYMSCLWHEHLAPNQSLSYLLLALRAWQPP